jgi:succinate-semialdehyde dehydrogenase/glutarate-semialdehyde dehydrogenase
MGSIREKGYAFPPALTPAAFGCQRWTARLRQGIHVTAYPDLRLLIDGVWRAAAEGPPVINPADETHLGRLPLAGRRDIDDAVAAAERGFAIWRRTSPAERARIMLEATRLLRERVETVAFTSTLEQGKPLAQSRLEVLRACDIIEWDAQEGRRLYGRVIPAEEGLRHTVLREPIGVVAAFTPWNFPVSSPARKIGGALASGCAIVLKASEETPAGAVQLAQAFIDAGLPPGVLNLVFGDPAAISEQLIAHPSIRLVTFTGSVPVGKHLAALAGRHMKPAIMELGGHGPVIVCGDADPVETALASVQIKTRNAGQVCVAPTRFFVHEEIYPRFVETAGVRAAQIEPGDGREPGRELGPLANPRRVEAMEALVADAVAKGARLVAGGGRPNRAGYYYPLTVLADVPDDAAAMQEEPFGPLMLIQPFKRLDEAVARANALPFGLAAYAFTDSAHAIDRLSSELMCGNLSINHFVASVAETPFGGVKDSGYGREGGVEGLHGYTTVKNISHRVRRN